MKVATESMMCLCGSKRFTNVFSYNAPPKLEIKFRFSSSEPYHREIHRCDDCGHFVSVHAMKSQALYGGDYVDSTYGDQAGIARSFNRIISLDPAKSDNAGRVARIQEFAAGRKRLSVLDVGSGLCVFLYAMKREGWDCTALDPDIRCVEHARNTVGIHACQGDFLTARDLGRFDIVTFNKVLEHVKDPVFMLAKSKDNLKPRGFVYVEVPDGEAAWVEGADREEFAIDHIHIFSLASVSALATRAGFRILAIERLQEPSTKYTLRAFLGLQESKDA